MQLRAGLALLFVLAACGGSAETEGVAPRLGLETHIVNGKPSTSALDSVVFLSISGGSCTGTLLAPNLVLTARHCIAQINDPGTGECPTFGASSAGSSVAVSIGTKADGTSVSAKGSKIFTETPNSACGFDIALVLLDKDVPGAKLSRIRLTPVAKGEKASTAGYGDDGSGTPTVGRFERANLAIDAVGPGTFSYTPKTGAAIPVEMAEGEVTTGESTCYGDSGGPLFDSSGAVIGVTSRGVADSCIDHPSIYTGTAAHAALIRKAAQASGHNLLEASSTGSPEGEGEPTSEEAEEEPAADEEPASSTSKRPASPSPVQSGGCAASPAPARFPLGDTALIAVLAIASLLAARRRV